MSVLEEMTRDEARKLVLERSKAVKLVREHPAHLSQYVKCIDRKTGEIFHFQMLDPEAPWYWQREYLDWLLQNQMTITLKGRQLGVTWISCLEALWYLITRPGVSVLGYSTNEDESKLLTGRIWDMFESCPPWLTAGIRVLKPKAGHRPSNVIELAHPDGRISDFTAMTSTVRAGHGRVAAMVLLDEAAYQEHASGIWKATVPTMADGGIEEGAIVTSGVIRVVSTANGMSNELTGEGNFYHHLWRNAGTLYPAMKKRFLRYDLHPRRHQAWKSALPMTPNQKAEQYPDNPREAFLMSGRPFFDVGAIQWYEENAKRDPQYRMRFHILKHGARREKEDAGPIMVYEEPKFDRKYAIGCDTAGGTGLDFSSAHVLDLTTMEIVAEMHAKMDPDLWAAQLHCLGKWYNTAKIAVENQDKSGLAVIIYLRDGKDGRPPYPRLYVHEVPGRVNMPERKDIGFPMNRAMRPKVINEVSSALREHSLPYVTEGLLNEFVTFVEKDTMPTPRAEDGTNDDRIFSLAIALELFRQDGYMPRDNRHKKRLRRMEKTEDDQIYTPRRRSRYRHFAQ